MASHNELKLNADENCPCCSGIPHKSCCGPILAGKTKAKTAVDLLRARYCAFVVGNVDFVMNTHHSKTKNEIKREDIEQWSKSSDWLGLEVTQTDKGQAEDTTGEIIFCARYATDGKKNEHWEHSLFEKEDGEWKFVDAGAAPGKPIKRTEPKLGRNDPCPCGSGKKAKKCCAA